jgi:hypothetical protein
MATFTHGSNADFYIADSGSTERELTTGLSSVSLSPSADTAEVSALNDTAKGYIAGLKDATVEVEGPRDVTIEGYLFGILGLARRFTYFPEGSSSGKVVYIGTAICTSFEDGSSVDDANRYSASFQVTGAVTRTTV